jgi:hypothetical protein
MLLKSIYKYVILFLSFFYAAQSFSDVMSGEFYQSDDKKVTMRLFYKTNGTYLIKINGTHTEYDNISFDTKGGEPYNFVEMTTKLYGKKLTFIKGNIGGELTVYLPNHDPILVRYNQLQTEKECGGPWGSPEAAKQARICQMKILEEFESKENTLKLKEISSFNRKKFQQISDEELKKESDNFIKDSYCQSPLIAHMDWSSVSEDMEKSASTWYFDNCIKMINTLRSVCGHESLKSIIVKNIKNISCSAGKNNMNMDIKNRTLYFSYNDQSGSLLTDSFVEKKLNLIRN